MRTAPSHRNQALTTGRLQHPPLSHPAMYLPSDQVLHLLQLPWRPAVATQFRPFKRPAWRAARMRRLRRLPLSVPDVAPAPGILSAAAATVRSHARGLRIGPPGIFERTIRVATAANLGFAVDGEALTTHHSSLHKRPIPAAPVTSTSGFRCCITLRADKYATKLRFATRLPRYIPPPDNAERKHSQVRYIPALSCLAPAAEPVVLCWQIRSRSWPLGGTRTIDEVCGSWQWTAAGRRPGATVTDRQR
jgi:hypothetical protein